MHDLVKAVDYARKSHGGPFVGIANGHGTMMFLRDRLKRTLKGLRVVDAQVGAYRFENGETKERVLVVHGVSEDGRVKAKRAILPALEWKLDPRLATWQLAQLRKMGRCECRDFQRHGACKHTQPKPKGKHEQAIAKLERQLQELRPPQNPSVMRGEAIKPHSDYRRTCMLWKLQRPTRRKIMQLARRTKTDLTAPKLYAELAKLTAPSYDMVNWDACYNDGAEAIYQLTIKPLKFKKWGYILGHERDRKGLHDLWDYVARLWEFCGLEDKPGRYEWAEMRDEASRWGRDRYVSWLNEVHEQRVIREQIAAIRAEAQA